MSTLELTIGTKLVATLFSCFLLGGLWVLVYNYWLRFPSDRLFFRGLVVTMTVAATLDTALNCVDAWQTLIAHFTDTTYISAVSWTLCALIPWIGLTCMILQFFLTYRIWIVSMKTWRVYPALTMLFTTAGAAISLYCAVWLGTQEYVTALNKIKKLIYIWWACHALSDLLTTTALLYFIVWVPRKRTGGQGLMTLRKVVKRAVECNALSLVWQTAIIIVLSQSATAGYAYLIPAYSITKVYCFSLLVALGTRASSSSGLDQVKDSSGPFSNQGGVGLATIGGGGAKGRSNYAGRSRYADVEVTVQQDVHVDDYSIAEKAHPFAIGDDLEDQGGRARAGAVNVDLASAGKPWERAERAREGKGAAY